MIYFNFEKFDENLITEFFNNLDENSIYEVTPFISLTTKSNEPVLVLSLPIKIERSISHKYLFNYLKKQINIAEEQWGFELNNFEEYNLYFMYRQL